MDQILEQVVIVTILTLYFTVILDPYGPCTFKAVLVLVLVPAAVFHLLFLTRLTAMETFHTIRDRVVNRSF